MGVSLYPLCDKTNLALAVVALNDQADLAIRSGLRYPLAAFVNICPLFIISSHVFFLLVSTDSKACEEEHSTTSICKFQEQRALSRFYQCN